ncbi:hypothetical protein [Streptomyces sp. cf386]|uniref:hypothetical protein n=1 Tax=Streptomyces sp. cf386 TaxID=1761904 RepID=UPI0015A3C7DC|nr:hypothetical protein [Streptomyces sp. cf386]
MAAVPARSVGGGVVGTDDASDDGTAVAAAELSGVRVTPVPSLVAVGTPAVSGGTVGVGEADSADVGDGDGVEGNDGSGDVVRLVAGGGASGGVGVVGPSGLAKCSGTAMRAATAHVAPRPAAVRRRRRRDALRRTAS